MMYWTIVLWAVEKHYLQNNDLTWKLANLIHYNCTSLKNNPVTRCDQYQITTEHSPNDLKPALTPVLRKKNHFKNLHGMFVSSTIPNTCLSHFAVLVPVHRSPLRERVLPAAGVCAAVAALAAVRRLQGRQGGRQRRRVRKLGEDGDHASR